MLRGRPGEALSEQAREALRAAARELSQAAEQTASSAREILGRVLALSETQARGLAESAAASRRRCVRTALIAGLAAALASAGAAVLATVTTLSVLEPRLGVLDLLRILWRAG